ncbi:triose-phosphate isomerase [Vulcanisaeta souniana]|uniref:Triosephosphate isomerase n=1 Tax=Vulcanisaeta souniana JCM 11219 TaxID=1293586 RepID=A0A830E318_9CREN|nr:triose-phosphate isomerase [Vulcanisaeta souniana]BDR92804.1 triose-phosphate isomerase [Vulcanisaeta souniana JCM 11219]GGI82022.1 triose-phosphate isomerase [Vulcanisaeta souniana JCM 11219]
MKIPILIINMKVYPEVLGRRALELAKVTEAVSRELGMSIAVAPPTTELRLVAENVEIPVYAQGADPVEPGARTGHVPLEFIKETGASGVILNHSENRLLLNDLGWLVNRAKNLGLETLVCAPDPYTSAAAAALEPTAVAVEPPELIGTGKAVSREKPDVIVKTVELVKRVNPSIPVITGAGIESYEDVKRAVELGTQGVLVASAIVKARDWRQKIMELAKALH